MSEVLLVAPWAHVVKGQHDPLRQYGQGLVRGRLEAFDSDDLRGFAIWLPMMRNDSTERARAEAAPFEGLNVAHFWDPEHRLGDLFAEALSPSSHPPDRIRTSSCTQAC